MEAWDIFSQWMKLEVQQRINLVKYHARNDGVLHCLHIKFMYLQKGGLRLKILTKGHNVPYQAHLGVTKMYTDLKNH